MKNKIGNYLIWSVGLIFTSNTFAITESHLKEVTPTNQTPCVEYYSKDGKTYCSDVPLVKPSTAQNYAALEKINLQFDDRIWKAAWGSVQNDIVTVEYTTEGDDINDWRELITSQFLPATQFKITPEQFYRSFIKQIQSSGLKPIINTISQSATDIIFEFRISEPSSLTQNEIMRAFSTPSGLYVVHYVIKEADMGEPNRKKWVDLLKQATPK